MYKLSQSLTDFSVEAHLIPNNERITRGSDDLKFVVPKAKKDVFKFSFFQRILWMQRLVLNLGKFFIFVFDIPLH